MKSMLLMLVFTAMSALPARAAMVTWFDSGELDSVSDFYGPILFPGLTAGTPWTLQLTFDPSAPGTPAPGGGSHCVYYPLDSATFTLGGFTYTSSKPGAAVGANIRTNFRFPGGCVDGREGLIMFEMSGWTQEPGAWNLNLATGLLIAEYTDARHRGGTLPSVPTLTGENRGVGFHDFDFAGPFSSLFYASPFAPTSVTPVPEPGTFAMLGVGLAYIARRLRRN